jgi:peptide/nickel transport system substrate-binding protein
MGDHGAWRTQLGRREFLQSVGAILGAGAGLSLAGCADTGPAANRPRDELTVGLSDSIVTLDSADHFSTATTSVLRHIYDPLVDLSDTGQLEQALATTWTQADARTWRFALRQGVTFHDGTPFNADAVVYTLDRVRADQKLELWPGFRDIEAVRKEGDFAVTVVSRNPAAALPSYLALLGIMPASARGREADYFKAPVGTGPYRFAQWLPGDRINLVARTGYWRIDRPRVPKLTFRFIPDPDKRLAALQAGEVDIFDRAAPDSIAPLRRLPGVRIVETPSVEVQRWHFNLARPPYNDKRVRQAVSLAIDRDRLIKEAMLGYARPAVSPLPEGMFGYVPLAAKPFDPARARTLLREAGHERLALNWVQFRGRYAKQDQISQMVTAMLAEVGIAATVRALPNPEALAARAAGEYDLFYSLWTHTTYDPDFYLTQWYTKAGGAQLNRFDNPQIEQMVVDARVPTPAVRQEKYAAIQRALWDEEYEIWAFDPLVMYGINDRLVNFTARRDAYLKLWSVGFASV